MSDLVFTTRGVAEVIAAQEKLAEQSGKQKAAARALSDEYRANEAELRKLGRVAEQIYRTNETAQERYNRKLAEAKAALHGNVNETVLLQREQQRLEKELRASGDTMSSAFAPGKIAGYAAGFMSIQTVVSAITAELRAQQDMIDKRNAAQLSVGQSRNVLLRNLVGNDDQTIRAVLAASTGISGETGVSEVSINQALASAVSATGGNTALSTALVRNAALFLKDRPEDIGTFAGSLGDLTRVLGTTDPNAALGLLTKIGQLSRITSPEKLSRNAAPALIGTMPFGGDARTSGALFAALTAGSADVSGEQSGTALISLAQQLDEASLGKGAFVGTEKKPGFSKGVLAGRNLYERIATLQRNPVMAQRFLDLASFERKSVGPITQLLLEPNSQVAKEFASAYGQIPAADQLSTLGRQSLGMFGKYNDLEQTAVVTRTIKTTLEQLQTRARSGYLSTEDLQGLRDISLETGGSSLAASLDDLIGKSKGTGKVPVSEVASRLRRLLGELEHPTVTKAYAVGNALQVTTQERSPTADEQSAAAILRKMLTQLEMNNAVLEKIKNKDGGMVAGAE